MNKAEYCRFKESFVSGQRGEVKGCGELQSLEVSHSIKSV